MNTYVRYRSKATNLILAVVRTYGRDILEKHVLDYIKGAVTHTKMIFVRHHKPNVTAIHTHKIVKTVVAAKRTCCC